MNVALEAVIVSYKVRRLEIGQKDHLVAPKVAEAESSAVAAVLAAVIAMFDEVETEVGPVPTLVHNAGISTPATLESYDATALERMRAVNVYGVIQTVRAVMPGMKPRGYGRSSISHPIPPLARATGHHVLCGDQGGSIDPDAALRHGIRKLEYHGERCLSGMGLSPTWRGRERMRRRSSNASRR